MARIRRAAQICLGVGLASGLSLDSWADLNTSVGGRLQQNVPMALPCFPMHNGVPHIVDEAECALIRANYSVAAFRATIPGTAMSPSDDSCLSFPQDQCLLDNTVTPAALPAANSSCNQGSLPTYRITVQSAADITTAFDFARQHRISISVKNSGHDYMTRNLQRESLLLWVHQLQNMSYHETFVPEGCKTKSYSPVLTIGTGVSADAATVFATAYNTTLLVGSTPTVAVSGGWVLGAGHSILAPVYGLGIDRVVQFTIVTPDGVLRVANACQNEDLFWALRGGGVGTFGVVLDASHRVEAGLTPVAVAHMTLPQNITASVSLEWVALQARHALQWGREGWGGHAAGTYSTHVNPIPRIANLVSGNGANAAMESMRAALDFVKGHGGTGLVEVLPSWHESWKTYVKPAASPVGWMVIPGNRLWPQRLFETEAGGQNFVDFTQYLFQQQGVDPRRIYISADSPFLVMGTDKGYDTNTSAHPSWYSSLWNYGGAVPIAWNSSYNDRLQAVVQATQMNKKAAELIGPGSGAYVHETNFFDTDWRESFWGPNYEALLKIKKKYDPGMLMRCWKCVGFEESSIGDSAFQCQGKLQVDVDGFFRNNSTG